MSYDRVREKRGQVTTIRLIRHGNGVKRSSYERVIEFLAK